MSNPLQATDASLWSAFKKGGELPLAYEKLEKRTLIQGKVTNDKGMPLIGATVIISGTSIGTATDLDGKYRLNIPVQSKTLDITYHKIKLYILKMKKKDSFASPKLSLQ